MAERPETDDAPHPHEAPRVEVQPDPDILGLETKSQEPSARAPQRTTER